MRNTTSEYAITTKYPVYEMAFRADFRRELVTEIINKIKAGQCVNIVGINGIGLNTLFKFLGWNKHVKGVYLRGEALEHIFINVDFIEVPQLTEESLYRLILLRTNEKAQDLALAACFSETTRSLFLKALDTNDTFILTEAIRAMLKDLITSKNRRIVYLFHNFDKIAAGNQAFLDSLMNFYLQFRLRLLFVMGLHAAPDRLRAGKEPSEFDKIFYNTVYFRPSTPADMITSLNLHLSTKGLSANQEQARMLFEYTGGIGAFTIIFAKNVSQNDLVDNFSFRKACELTSSLPEIKAQCELILKNLNLQEIETLKALAGGNQIKDHLKYLPYLDNLSLIYHKTGSWKVASKWLQNYLLGFENNNKPLQLDKERGKVWVNGQSIDALSKQEFRILSFLYDNEGKVCSKDEIAGTAWDVVSTDGVSDEAIDQAISRLRRKIETSSSNPRYIQTVRSRGFVFNRNLKI